MLKKKNYSWRYTLWQSTRYRKSLLQTHLQSQCNPGTDVWSRVLSVCMGWWELIHSPKKYGQLNVKVFRTVYCNWYRMGEAPHGVTFFFGTYIKEPHCICCCEGSGFSCFVHVENSKFSDHHPTNLDLCLCTKRYTQLFAHIHLKIHQHNSAFCCIFCGAVFYFSFWDVSGRFCCCVCPPLAVKSW